MTKSPRRFTAEEDETIRAMRRKGVPVIKIAELLGREYATTHRRAGLIGARARGVTDEDVAEIFALRGEGTSIKDIAKRMHRTGETIRIVLDTGRAPAPRAERVRLRKRPVRVAAPPPSAAPDGADLSDLLYRGRVYEDHPRAADREFRPQRVGVLDPLGGLRRAS